MSPVMPGLHHVTAISGAPQENVDFYTTRLGQRLIKKTINFDAPDTYHLYYGSHEAAPGTILTFFPFVDAGPGRAGPGMASAVAYGVTSGGLNVWIDRFADDATESDGIKRLRFRSAGGDPGAGHGVVEEELRHVRGLLNRA